VINNYIKCKFLLYSSYKPPFGYAKENVFLSKKSSPFEMSKLKNKELFLIRVPVDVIKNKFYFFLIISIMP